MALIREQFHEAAQFKFAGSKDGNGSMWMATYNICFFLWFFIYLWLEQIWLTWALSGDFEDYLVPSKLETLHGDFISQLWKRFRGSDKPPVELGSSRDYNIDMILKVKKVDENRPSLRKELDLSVEKDLIKFLTWFYPLKYWKKLCQDGPEFFTVHLHREVTAWVSRFLEGHAEPFMKIYEQHMESIIVREEDYPEFQRYIFAQNKVIPKEIWPREGIQPDVRQDDEIYYERIKSARNQYYYELNQAKRGEDIWSQDPWNFDDIDSVLEEVEKIEKAYAQKSRKKRPEDKSQWNKDVWRTKRRQSGMDRQEWVNYMGYPSYSSYSTESDTASDEDSVMDLQFRGEWMIMKASQPEWDSQSWKGKRFMKEG
nr:guanosine nucleotide diphosphate dissociation inhibitor 1 [Ipomoea batatas]